MLWKVLSRRTPALFTTMSTVPKASTAVFTMLAARRGLGDGIVVGDGLAAGRLDLVDHLVGRGVTAALAVDRATRIVHDHLGATAGQQERMRAAEPLPAPVTMATRLSKRIVIIALL